jgi:hypothetical protein
MSIKTFVSEVGFALPAHCPQFKDDSLREHLQALGLNGTAKNLDLQF